MIHEPTTRRLLRLYDATGRRERRAGARWYPQELDWIGEQIAELSPGVPLRHGATIYAALSPQMPWDRNRELVRAVLRGDSYPGGVFQRSWDRATRAIVEGPLVLGGPKVISFDCNLAGCVDCVTCDIHMHRLANWPVTGSYGTLADSLRAAARRRKTPPAHLQATLWLAYRPGRPLDPKDNA